MHIAPGLQMPQAAIKEALPLFWGDRGTMPFISGEQGNKSKGNREQRQLWRTGNIENQDFDFGVKRKMPIYFKGTGTPL